MRIARQLVSFATGLVVGLCLYFLPRASRILLPSLRPVSTAVASPADHASASSSIHKPSINRAAFAERKASREPRQVVRRIRAIRDSHPAPETSQADSPEPATASSTILTSPPPLTFKPLGYVEIPGGQLEAIISQENDVQVVHIGDHISGHYQVTKISPESVEADDEELTQAPRGAQSARELTAAAIPEPAKPQAVVIQDGPAPGAAAAESPASPNSEPHLAGVNPIPNGEGAAEAQKTLGYVEQADGRIQTVIADADTVRLETGASTEVAAGPTPAAGSTVAAVTQPLPGRVPNPVEAVADADILHSDNRTVGPEVMEVEPTDYQASAGRSAPGFESILRGQMAGNPIAADPTSFISRDDSLASGPDPASSSPPVLMIPLGYVVRQDGELAAIVPHDDEIYIVSQGDRFDGQYRALTVTADAVEVVEEPPRQAHPPPIRAPVRAPPDAPFVLAAARDGAKSSARDDCIRCESPAAGEVSSKSTIEASSKPEIPALQGRIEAQGRIITVKTQAEASTDSGIYVFQKLGSIETADGETRAIVADESDLYLVKQGETFAGRYRAISVEAAFVLAGRETAGPREGNYLSAQAVSPAKGASKTMNGNLHFPLSALEDLQAFHPGHVLVNPGSDELGPTPLNFSLTETGLEPESIAAGNPGFRF